MGKVWKVVAFAVAFAITSRLICTPKEFDYTVLSGRRVLITGASSGIGEELAFQYAKHGASVFITARREHLLKQVTEKCKKIGSKKAKFSYFAADMAKFDQIDNLVASAIEHFGGFDDVIINHALLVDLKNPDNLREAMKILRTSLAVNTEAPAYLAGLALPYLTKSHGNIGVVNSMGGKLALQYARAYSTSKFALDGYFASLRDEVRNTNVSITNIVLGLIGTQAAHDIIAEAKHSTDIPLENLAFSSVETTADFIIKGVTNREREIYYPTRLSYMVLLNELLLRYDMLGTEDMLNTE